MTATRTYTETDIALQNLTCLVLSNQLRDVRKAYMTGVRGFTYDDMKAAAIRVLEARNLYERMTGRKPVSSPSASQIAAILRG